MKILILLPYLLLLGVSICKSSILALPLKVKNTFKGGNNYIHAFLRGIELLSNDISAGTWVQNDIIDIGMNLAPISTTPGIGILINEANNPNQVLVERCTVNVYNAREGINVSNQHSANVLRNHVEFFPAFLSLIYATNARHGITTNNCDRLRVNCNTVIGNSLAGTVSQNAFYIVNTRNSEIACNSSDNSPNGFHFAINCPGTDFRSNNIGAHFRGLLLNSSATIDLQAYKGNIWRDAIFYGSGFGAIHLAPNTASGALQVAASKFEVNPVGTLPPTWTYFPSNFALGSASSGWFVPNNSQTNALCFDFPEICLPLPTVNIDINALDESIANGSFTTSEFPEENKWLVSEAIYNKYADNDSLLQIANDTIQAWVDSLAQKNIGELHQLHTETAGVLNTTESTIHLLHSAADSSYLYADSLAVIDSLLQTATGNDSLLLLNRRVNLLNGISQIAENQREILEPIDNNALSSLNNTNTAIQSNIQAELNQKAINEIYLATIAQGHRDFSLSQVEMLAEIAYQCPITGGNAVFLARGLYEFINPEAVYDDEGTCATQGEQWRHSNNGGGEDGQNIKLYPNPTDGQCTITFANRISHYTVRLVNNLGQVIENFDILENSTSYNFSVRSLTEGVYFCEIISNSKVLHREKLVIIR